MQEKKIKSITSKRFNYIIKSLQDNEVDIDEVPSSYKLFDLNGNLICEISYNSEGVISEKTEFDYVDNLLIQKRIFLDETEVAEYRKYFYDIHGNIDYVLVQYTDDTEEKIIYQYDADHNLISKKSEEGDGGYEVLKYDGKNLIFHQIIDDFDEVEKEENRKYSSDGRLILIDLKRYEDGELRNILIHFDIDSKIFLEEVKDKNNALIESKYLNYNDKGHLIEIKTISDEEERILNFEFDENGNEILQQDVDSQQNIHHSVKRTFDENNNVLSADVEIFNYGKAIDFHYKIEYSFIYF